MTFTIQSRHVKLDDVEVRLTSYQDGSPALVAIDVEGNEVLSTNLAAYGLVPEAGFVYVKDYSEHEGLPDALSEAGVAHKIEPVRFGPWGHGWLMRVSGRVTDE